MENLEKVLDGLECCITGEDCVGCPYHEQCAFATDCNPMHEDIVEIVKEYKRITPYIPPVVVGTPIYSVVWNNDTEGFHVMENVVEGIWYNCNGWFFTELGHRGPGFKASDIGHVIYLNREDAEAICEEFNFKLPRKSKRI